MVKKIMKIQWRVINNFTILVMVDEKNKNVTLDIWNLNNVIMEMNSEQYLKRDINFFLELSFWLTSLYVCPVMKFLA